MRWGTSRYGKTVLRVRIVTTANSGTSRTIYHRTSNDRLARRVMSSICLFVRITGISGKLCHAARKLSLGSQALPPPAITLLACDRPSHNGDRIKKKFTQADLSLMPAKSAQTDLASCPANHRNSSLRRGDSGSARRHCWRAFAAPQSYRG
jgi:hypothetical protein